MGEVYRAHDSRLGRDVAIKVLPSEFSRDPDRLRRFEQEARAAGMLNHPNILVIYDVGTHQGAPYVVSELLEGETLRARLGAGEPLPQRKALEHAVEIARGLAAAHQKGIVHRDLKPENLFLAKGAGLKILDFGLAKLTHLDPGEAAQAPTSPMLTQAGVVMGTAGYMSPEQVAAQPADHRADIFAFGAILYEMLCGRRAFTGNTAIEALNAILKHDPPELAGASPLERVLRRCLEKAPEDRFQSARDLGFALEALAGASAAEASKPVLPPRRFRFAAWVAAALALLAAVLAAIILFRPSPPQPALARFFVHPPAKTMLDGGVTVSPDGKHLAFTAVGAAGRVTLWVRSLDSLEPRELPGTAAAAFPFWSPDSRSLAFFAEEKLKSIPLSGGSPQTLCDVNDSRGGAWSQQGGILLALTYSDGLYRVSPAGGKPALQTTLEEARGEVSHRWPQFLPGGRSFLYYVYSARPNIRGVYAGSLDSKETRLVVNTDRMGIYALPAGAPTGSLLFLRGSTLMSQPFDHRRHLLTGEPAPVADGLWRHAALWGLAAFSASQSGLLAYRGGGVSASQMTWFDRQGKSIGPAGPPGGYEEPWLSPDETRLVVVRDGATKGTLWVLDLARDAFSRFSFGASEYLGPLWSPDGRRIAFAANPQDLFGIYTKNADGAGTEQLLFRSDAFRSLILADWSPDGRFLLLHTTGTKTQSDLWALPVEGGAAAGQPVAVAQTEAWEAQGRFSPDGKWVAYSSNEAGKFEIFVQPFPPTGAKWQVSTSGGFQPQWRRDGKELFYVASDRKLMAAEVQTGTGFQVRAPQALFQTQILNLSTGRNAYIAAGNGRRFLVINSVPDAGPITVVLNWQGKR